MISYFIAGCLFGLLLMGLFMYSSLMKLRSELMAKKKVNDNLEKLNAELQMKMYAASNGTLENHPAKVFSISK